LFFNFGKLFYLLKNLFPSSGRRPPPAAPPHPIKSKTNSAAEQQQFKFIPDKSDASQRSVGSISRYKKIFLKYFR